MVLGAKLLWWRRITVLPLNRLLFWFWIPRMNACLIPSFKPCSEVRFISFIQFHEIMTCSDSMVLVLCIQISAYPSCRNLGYYKMSVDDIVQVPQESWHSVAISCTFARRSAMIIASWAANWQLPIAK